MSKNKYTQQNTKTLPEELEEAEREFAMELAETIEANLAIQIHHEDYPIPINKETVMSEDQVQVEPGFVSAIKEYIRVMDPKLVISSSFGGKQQYNLWNTIKGIITFSTSQNDFNTKWNLLLIMVQQYRDTIFNEGVIFRFPESWAGSQSEFTVYRRIMHVIISTCDPSIRHVNIKKINLNMALSEGLTEAEKNKLINFYQ